MPLTILYKKLATDISDDRILDIAARARTASNDEFLLMAKDFALAFDGLIVSARFVVDPFFGASATIYGAQCKLEISGESLLEISGIVVLVDDLCAIVRENGGAELLRLAEEQRDMQTAELFASMPFLPQA